MSMNRLENLPEVSEHVLSGLKADSGLKHRILLSASSAPAVRKYSFKTVVALCSLSVILILLCVFALQTKNSADLQVIPAGSRHSTPPVRLETVLENADETDSR